MSSTETTPVQPTILTPPYEPTHAPSASTQTQPIMPPAPAQSGGVTHSDMAKVLKMAWILLGGAFALGLWVATIQLGQLQVPKNQDEIRHLRAEHLAMEKWKISVDSTRYTLRDRANDTAAHNDAKLLQEKRLQRLEDTQLRIEDTLEEIAETLKRPNQVPG